MKYEEIYLKAYVGAAEARKDLEAYFHFYNDQTPHQALGYRTPAQVFFGHTKPVGERKSRRTWSEKPMLLTNQAAAELSLSYLSN